MPRYAQDYEKKLIALRAGDVDAVRRAFPNHAYSAVIRSIVSQFVDAVEAGRAPNLSFDPNKIEVK